MRKIRKSIRLAIEKAMDMLVRLFVEKFCFSGESGDHHGNLMVHCDDCDNLRHGRTQFACSLAKSLGNSSPGTRTCRNMLPALPVEAFLDISLVGFATSSDAPPICKGYLTHGSV